MTPYRQSSTVETNSLAVIALIGGVGSWLGFPIVGALVGIICGHIARGQIRRQGGSSGDHQMATIGMVLGYIHMVLGCLVAGVVLLMVAGVIGAGVLSGQ